MRAPLWARLLLRLLAPRDRTDEVLGDLEETHRSHLERGGWTRATLRTGLETMDMAFALLCDRVLIFSRLDFKLGFRMLVKYPGLTVVAGLAIAFAVGVGSGTVEFLADFLYPTMPFDEGDRMVEVHYRNLETGGIDRRILHDFEIWRQEARSLVELGAFVTFRRNMVTDQGRGKPVQGAEMTAAAFGLPRVPPLMGRLLAEADETPGAPDVVVIGYDLWKSTFGGDLEVVGKTVRLGPDHATVVGVMPRGFSFPQAQNVWTPFRLRALDYAAGEGPGVVVLGRLAPGATLEEARTELATTGLPSAESFPETQEHLKPYVMQAGRSSQFEGNWLAEGLFFGAFVAFSLLMLLVCANVALLIFARTSARESEITIRTALGAARGQIVSQLFVEALILGLVAAAVGLWAGHLGLDWFLSAARRMGPGGLVGFWFDSSLSARTVTCALGLTVLAAGGAGVVPALRATGKGIQPTLQRSGAGRGGPGFGRLWTTVIVTQIALTVTFIPVVIVLGYQTAEIHAWDMGFEAEQYLSARVVKDPETMAPAVTPRDTNDPFRELKRRLAVEPGISGVALASNVPGANHPLRRIQVEGPSAPTASARGHRVATGWVDLDFFDLLGAPILSGRGFRASDLEADEHVAIVNEDFARVVLEDRNPIGRRFAYTDGDQDPEGEVGAWYEIVGVVRQVAMQIDPDLHSGAGLYHPLNPEDQAQVVLAMRVGGDPTGAAQRLHQVVAEVDPTLLLYDIRPMDEGAWETELLYGVWFWVVVAAGGIGLLLTLAGIYSIMAFTVSRRTREIGVRVALGADGRRVVSAIFSRVLLQVGLGVAVGGLLLAVVVIAVSGGSVQADPTELLMAGGYLAAMFGVCLLACVVPTRRALAIEPTEALRAEA